MSFTNRKAPVVASLYLFQTGAALGRLGSVPSGKLVSCDCELGKFLLEHCCKLSASVFC